jgi:hypothetical protein
MSFIRETDSPRAVALALLAVVAACLAIASSGCVVPRPPAPSPVEVTLQVTDAADGSPVPNLTASLLFDDDQTPIFATRTDLGRVTFVFPSVRALPYGAELKVASDGYELFAERRVVYRDRPIEAVALVQIKVPTYQPRPGVVRVENRSFVDDDGPFLGLGASLFWAVWGYEHDRDRLRANFQYLADQGVDYVRILGVVGPTWWVDRTADPTSASWASSLEGAIDLAYEFGLRTELTIFGGIERAPTPEARRAIVNTVISIVSTRQEKIQHLEIVNEGYGTGWGGPLEPEAKDLATAIRAQLPHAVATTAPDTDPATMAFRMDAWYSGSAANLATFHLDRSYGDEGWRHVRQARDPSLFWGGAWTANEPIGPQSSVAQDDDPLRLTAAMVFTYVGQGAGYVLHTGAGIRGGGLEDLQRGRSANVWEVPNVAAILRGMTARALLPGDLASWSFQNNNRQAGRNHPFNVDHLVPLVEGGQLLRAFCAVSGTQFVCIPTRAKVPVPFEARYPMAFTVHDPMSGEVRETVSLDTGETWTLQPTDFVILKGDGR